jgi:ATP-binding cassette subfamily C exporter for protease/lipase
MYGDPALLVLDEPNSNLDEAGEQALLNAVLELRRRGKTIVMITHRPNAVQVTTKLLLMRDGAVHMFGPTNQVLAAVQDAAKKAMDAQAAAQAQAQAQAAQRAQATAGATTGENK